MRPIQNMNRKRDVKRALDAAKADDKVSLNDLAAVWGTTKANFSNEKAKISAMFEWPKGEPGPRNSIFWPARECLDLMMRYLERNDAADNDRRARIAAIMGEEESTREALPVNELATMSRLRAEIEVREREQGKYVSAADVAAVAANVFGILSGYLGDMATALDPKGQWPAEVRAQADKSGKALLLRVHANLRDTLAGNVDAEAHRSKARARGSARRSGAPRTRRKA